MQTTQDDFEVRAEMPVQRKETGIHMPETRTLIIAAAIAGGAVATGLVMYYLLRKRREATMGH
jgi:hypothetical protein